MPIRDNSLLQSSLHLSVLLVEDIELNVIVAKSALEKLGHHVDVAMNGREAIHLFERNTYDIVLLDIKLPDMSGFDIAEHFRQKYEDGIYDFLPPLVAFTANVMQTEQEYLAKGLDAVLRKPLALGELRHCLYRFFAEEMEPSSGQTAFMDKTEHQTLNTELIGLLGKTQMAQNLALFKQMMPNYLSELHQTFNAYRQNHDLAEQVADLAHKIKGAAASVGLLTVQGWAEKMQHNEAEDWRWSIELWLNKLDESWQDNVKELEDYLNV